MTRCGKIVPAVVMPCSDFFPPLESSPGGRYQKGYVGVITVDKGAAMKKSVVLTLFLALFAAMAMPVADIGPVQTQACGTDKPPPPV